MVGIFVSCEGTGGQQGVKEVTGEAAAAAGQYVFLLLLLPKLLITVPHMPRTPQQKKGRRGCCLVGPDRYLTTTPAVEGLY
jgi:hypothetical protein